VARSAPDGYTVLSNTLPFVANPALHSKPPYDVIREFEPVMLMANQVSMIALHPSVPVKNVKCSRCPKIRAPGQSAQDADRVTIPVWFMEAIQ
jgi:hypothetical protein